MFERLMFRLLIPGVLLAAVAAITLAALFDAPGADDQYGISGFASAAYFWVLIGSMTLHAWRLLRHPQSATSGRIPRAVAVNHAVMYVVIVVWPTTFALGFARGVLALTFGTLLAILSIVDLWFIYRRKTMTVDTVQWEVTGFGRALPRVMIGVLIVAFLLGVIGYTDPAYGLAGSVGLVLLGALGLPWSWPLYTVITLFGAGVSELPFPDDPVSNFVAAVLRVLVLGAPAIVNIVIAFRVTRSDDAFTIAANRFFRLKGQEAQAHLPPETGEARQRTDGPLEK